MNFSSKIIGRIKLFFCKDKELYSSLYALLGIYPRRLDYYRLAFSHKSVRMVNEGGQKVNNERLEYLGDAIIEAVVSDILYHRFPRKQEGFLTVTRSKIVKRDTLNRVGFELGLKSLLHEDTGGNIQSSHIAGNAFEALFGAIYLDLGYMACYRFMNERVVGRLIDLDKMAREEVNFKSRLLEWGQKNQFNVLFGSDETYKEGNIPYFRSRVLVEELVGGIGTGRSKKESHQMAAKETVRLLKKHGVFYESVVAAKKKRLAAVSKTE